jgi:Fe-S cluster assembly ATPase SufC|tara:strand:- start:7550 stop:7840 length:291 start_codon:yes stop_codon:yes gene_type:complete
MVNKTLTIIAPDDLLDATVAAYATESGLDLATSTPEEIEAAAIEQMISEFRNKVVNHTSRVEKLADRAKQNENTTALEEAMKARRSEVEVTIKPAV